MRKTLTEERRAKLESDKQYGETIKDLQGQVASLNNTIGYLRVSMSNEVTSNVIPTTMLLGFVLYYYNLH